MDFGLTEDQQIFQRMVRDFATNELQPVAAQVDEEEKFPAENVRKMAELGLMGVSHSRGIWRERRRQHAPGHRHRGNRPGLREHVHHLSWPHSRWRATPYTCLARRNRRGALWFLLAKGQKLACFALTEPGAGSDAAAIQTTATRPR